MVRNTLPIWKFVGQAKPWLGHHAVQIWFSRTFARFWPINQRQNKMGRQRLFGLYKLYLRIIKSLRRMDTGPRNVATCWSCLWSNFWKYLPNPKFCMFEVQMHHFVLRMQILLWTWCNIQFSILFFQILEIYFGNFRKSFGRVLTSGPCRTDPSLVVVQLCFACFAIGFLDTVFCIYV